MKRLGLRALALVAALVTLGVVLPARADDASARTAFRRGVELYDKKRWGEALAAFEEAYRAKPSAIIKQNVGLCHARLGHLVPAATAFDEALEEGATTLSPETKRAIAEELRELELRVATVRVRVVDAKGAALSGARLSVDGVELPLAAEKRPVRLEPGTHVVGARAPGFLDPEPKRLSLEQGSPVDATFELALAPLPAPHIEMLPPEGAGPTAPAAPPPPYAPPSAKAPPGPKRFLVGVTLALGGESLRLGEGSGEAPGGARRGFVGGALGLRGGYRFARMFSAELRAEAGVQTARYELVPGVPRETKTDAAHLQLSPTVRFATPGSPRFTAATGVGLHATTVTVEIARQANTERRKGSGLAASWIVDAGAQFDAGPLVVEATLFSEVFGVSNARDDILVDRMLLASPSVRYGARVGLLVPF